MLFIGGLLLLGGVALPRFYASLGMMLLVLPVFFLHPLKLLVKKYLADGFSWSIGLLFLLPFLSGVYSSNIKEWLAVCQIKLPLLLLPFAALAWPPVPGKYVKGTSRNYPIPHLWRGFKGEANKEKQVFRGALKPLQAFFVLALFAACSWSIGQYLANETEMTDAYLRAKVMPVLMGNSHIWFSYMVVAGILFLIITWPAGKLKQWLHVAGIAFFAIFLHLLAAKTGLVFLYGSGFVLALRWLFTKNKKWMAVVAIAIVLALPFIAMQVLPTFKNRVLYMRYDFTNVANGQFVAGSNDGNRVISLQAGWDIVKENTITGIGYGDIIPAVKNWYNTNRPQTAPEEFIPPSNNWLLMWCGVGIAAFAAIGLVSFYLFKSNPNKKDWCWYLLCAMAFLSTLYENPFESQYGVYAFLVPFLVWRKLVQPANNFDGERQKG